MNEFIDSESIFKTLGDFWYSHYDNKDQVRDLVYALVEVQKQIVEDTSFLEKSINRHTINPFRKLLWFPVHVLESDMLVNSKRFINYGNTLKYADGISYGNPTFIKYTIKLPEKIVSVSAIQDKIINPKLVINDIKIKDHKIELDSNPFDTPSVYVNPIYNELGEEIDREAVLWLYSSYVDEEDLYNLFGYVLGFKLESSERYKQLINALFDALINGPSKTALSECMSAITGIPVIKENSETVLSVCDNCVITDKNTYIFSYNDNVTVKVGDNLTRGDTLTKGLQITNSPDEIKGIQLIPQITHGISNNLFVTNTNEVLTIDTTCVKTIVTFPVLGTNEDVKQFNNIMLKQGITDSTLITDSCELANIRKILQIPNTTKFDENDTEVVSLNAGLTTWVRTRRLA